jgi:flagellar motor switch protein FliM
MHQETPAQSQNAAPEAALRPWDFKQPQRLGPETIRRVKRAHERFAQATGAQLTGFLRSIVDCTVVSVEQMSFGEYVDSRGDIACAVVVEGDGHGSPTTIDISREVFFAVLTSMLGGHGDSAEPPSRRLTQIETRMARTIGQRLLAPLKSTWSHLQETSFRMIDVEATLQEAVASSPPEMVVAITCRVEIDSIAGTIGVCVPSTVFDDLGRGDEESPQPHVDSDGAGHIVDHLTHAPVDVAVVLAMTTMSLQNVRSLAVGDIITTEHPASGPATICVEGQATFTGRPGTRRGRSAIGITSVLR